MIRDPYLPTAHRVTDPLLQGRVDRRHCALQAAYPAAGLRDLSE